MHLITRNLDTVISRYSGYIYAAILLAIAWVSDFAVLSNDCFPLRWQADHLSLHDPQTFYNGFFPIGYPLLLRIASFTGNPILAVMLLQMVVSALYAAIAYKLARTYLGECVAPIALLPLLFSPQILRAVLSATPDFLAAMAVLAACWYYASNKNFALAGICLGFGYLCRAHVIVFVIAFSVALVVLDREQFLRRVLMLWIGVLPFVLAQGLVQVWSGHGFFENAQAFNVWRTMHGMDWNNPPDLHGAMAFDLVVRQPGLFLLCMSIGIGRSAADLIPLAFVIVFAATTKRLPRTFSVLALAMFVYIGINTGGGSPRSLIASLPIVVISWAYIAQLILKRLLTSRSSALAFYVLLVIALGATFYFASQNSRPRIAEYRSIEQTLHVKSPGDAQHIYTDDFDLYFPDLQYHMPRTSGGWPEVGLPHYLERFPHIRDTSSRVEHDDLVRSRISWAVMRIPPYDGRGYESVRSDSSLFQLVQRTTHHEIYRVR